MLYSQYDNKYMYLNIIQFQTCYQYSFQIKQIIIGRHTLCVDYKRFLNFKIMIQVAVGNCQGFQIKEPASLG